MKPEFSIIIPVYNLGHYVGGAIDSCLTQGLAEGQVEVIVVDDGSRDDTPSLLEAYGYHPHVRVLTQPNQGVSAARNNGVQAARGEYVLFLDADDRLAPRTLLENRDLLRTSPETDWLLFPVIRTTPELKEINLDRTDFLPSCKYRRVEELSAAEALERSLQGAIPPIACAGIFKLDLVRRHPFSPGRFEDSRFFYRLLHEHTRLLLSPHGAYYYVDMPDSFIHAAWSAEKWCMYVMCCLEKTETGLTLLPDQAHVFIKERTALYYTLAYLKKKFRRNAEYARPLETYLSHLPKPPMDLKQEGRLLFKTLYAYLRPSP